jgi:Family of unknown function (DUF6247)
VTAELGLTAAVSAGLSNGSLRSLGWPEPAPMGRHTCRCGVGRLATAAARKLSLVTAQPAEDPADPQVILRDLPQRERDEFLRQYHQAVDAAHDPAGYQQLRRLLHVWSLTAIATGQPGYYEELAAAQAGTTATLPITDAIPDWTERAAAARNRK